MPPPIRRDLFPAEHFSGGAVFGIEPGKGIQVPAGLGQHTEVQGLAGVHQGREEGVIAGVAEVLRAVIGLLVEEGLFPGPQAGGGDLQGAAPRMGLLLRIADVAQGITPAADGVGAAGELEMAALQALSQQLVPGRRGVSPAKR